MTCDLFFKFLFSAWLISVAVLVVKFLWDCHVVRRSRDDEGGGW